MGQPTRWRMLPLLSRCLTEIDDVAAALRSFQATRLARTAHVQLTSRQNTWGRQAQDTSWVYGYDALHTPLVYSQLRCRPTGARLPSEVLRFHARAKAHVAPRDHEHSIAPVVKGLGVLGRGRDVGLYDLEYKEAIPCQEFDEPALKIGIALLDQWRVDALGRHRGQRKLRELVDAGTGAIADADCLADEVIGRDVDGALLAGLDQVEAVVLVPNVAADAGGLEVHDRVPAHGHDVGMAPPRRAHQHDRAGLEEATDLGDWQVLLGGGLHGSITRALGGELHLPLSCRALHTSVHLSSATT